MIGPDRCLDPFKQEFAYLQSPQASLLSSLEYQILSYLRGKIYSLRSCSLVPKELDTSLLGEVPEWSNGAVSKTVEQATVPRVRIPLSPPQKREPQAASELVMPWLKSEEQSRLARPARPQQAKQCSYDPTVQGGGLVEKPYFLKV